MLLSEIYKPIQPELESFEGSFKKQLFSNNGFAQYLPAYLLRRQGKRLRPALVLFSAKINNQKITPSVLSLAVAMELIHSASLTHDDVIDGANLRRKSPTINAEGKNQLAVLVGDYLYSQASIILSEINHQEILSNLSQTTNYMCQSEIFQLSRRYDLNLKEEEYLKIIKNKTASLITNCCRNAAILAKAPREKIEALADYGFNFGLAFQIVDDCLDFMGEEKILGKALGLDLKRGSLTLPLIYLMDSSLKKEAKLLLKNIFSGQENNATGLKNFNRIKDMVLQNNVLSKTYKKAEEYINQAQESLKIFEGSPIKTSLIELSELCLRRSN